MSHCIATYRPSAGGVNDVREVQLRRDRRGVHLWLLLGDGRVVLLRGRGLLDGVAAGLCRAGYGARQEVLV